MLSIQLKAMLPDVFSDLVLLRFQTQTAFALAVG
jgi:hypothetical protein